MSVRISAHRGDPWLYRENTLPAIRSAIAAGADLVEIDIHLGADSDVIVIHDDRLDRLWEVPVAVADLTAADLLAMGPADERPPLLSEVLPLFSGTGSTVLIDVTDPAAAESAWHLTREHPEVSIAWCGDTSAMWALRRLEDAARLWLAWDRVDLPTAADLQIAPESINTSHVFLTPELVARVHELGCVLTAWTIDDPLAMAWARDLGVDIITTNRMRQLRAILDEPSGEPASMIDQAAIITAALGRGVIEFTRAADLGDVQSKRDGADLVTDVDTSVELLVRAIIGLHFPDHGFVGEELGGEPLPGEPTWYLDPVDGTANLANRIPWTSFSLALAIDDVPQVAVVVDPWRGDVFTAVRGRGSFLNGTRLDVRAGATRAPSATGDPLAGTIVLTELANQFPWPGMLDMLAELGERACTLRVMGSGTLTLTGIAAGRGSGAVIGSFSPIDHLAATLIVDEAGGVVRSIDGDRNLFPSFGNPDAGGILAAVPACADALTQVWQRAIGPEGGQPRR